MIIYQVEVTVPADLVDQWIEYMTSHHIDDVVGTGMFIRSELHRLTDPIVEGHSVFRVRYTCESQEKLTRYRTEFAPALMADHTRIFGDRVVATRTVSERIWSTER
ncbi:MAG: DUF4286 family protein [Candidatus Kapabacteria bacterium]|nr:DUF4286 family protein [Candidatus Kapabacteria bacterium]